MRKKILICDDDEVILEVLQIILEEEGYDVLTLSETPKVFDVIKKYCPHLILLDIWMPGINGVEITEKLKNDKKTNKIPVIMVSALNDAKKIAKESGADDLLEKPFNTKDLLKKVEYFTNSSS